MSSSIGKRALVTSTVIAAFVGSGLAVAPEASAAVTSTMSTNAYKFANNQRGDAYPRNGQSTTGFSTYDCSGLVWRSYQQAGKKWTRNSADYMRKHQTIDITSSQRRVGDLIFFKRKNSDNIYDHVGIYAGHGYMIDAQTGTYYGHGVVKEPIDGRTWWSKYYVIDYRRVN